MKGPDAVMKAPWPASHALHRHFSMAAARSFERRDTR
jgi:hypothetical protein